MTTVVFLMLAIPTGWTQYLQNEPAVPPLLEGIRYCAMEPMAGTKGSDGLRWFKEITAGAQSCVRNAAAVQVGRESWLIYANMAGQIRALVVGDLPAIDEETCESIRRGATAPNFDLSRLAENVATQQRRILLQSEEAKPARTSRDRLQFALCHGALVKLLREHGLERVLSRAESERLNRVHRGDPVPHGGGAAVNR